MLADLHDGRGMQPEVGLKRWTYEDDYLGTCIQTFDGGLHFRYFVQNISQVTGESKGGAIFLAVSEEHDLTKNHDIVFDGYNLGRDYLVGNLTQQRIETKMSVSNSSTGGLDRVTVIDPSIEYQGTEVFEGVTYRTSVRYHAGLARNTSGTPNPSHRVSSGCQYHFNLSTDLIIFARMRAQTRSTTKPKSLPPGSRLWTVGWRSSPSMSTRGRKGELLTTL